MKQRFSSLDVKVIAHELSGSLSTLRLSNVYDLSSRIFLFKFAKPNVRQQLLIESGFRCHLTKFARATAAEPSAFVARLRKFLRTRRVTGVSQVGTDRVLEITFSEGQYRLFLEFYAGGNVILTNAELKVLTLLRVVPPGEQQEELRVGLTYAVENRQNYAGVPALTRERILTGLQKAAGKTAAGNDASKKKVRPGGAFRKALAVTLAEIPPALIEHAISMSDLSPVLTVEDVLGDSKTLDKVVASLKKAQELVARILSESEMKGYVIAKPAIRQKQPDEEVDKENVAMIYEEFHPFCPHQFIGRPGFQIIDFNGFNATVDEFFSTMESQKLESRLGERHQQANKKLDAARADHEKRLQGLQQVQELNVRKAQAIESNIQRVQEATAAINGLIAQGMDWVQIDELIKMEQSRQNPVAGVIHLPLKLDTNTATLLLGEADFEDEGDYEGDTTDSEASEDEDSEDEKQKASRQLATTKPEEKRLNIDIDLSLSPWANARDYYDQKKSAAVKEKKTLDSSERALKSTENKVITGLKKSLKNEREVLRPLRKQLWFEKFFYFITTEGYLVIGGRDTQQMDLLYRRYLQKGDIWVHADINGAVPFIVKNRPGQAHQSIPPNTLSQAGTLAVATSTAWDSKAVMAAWWVDYSQVHKLDSTGHYLDAGSFIITREKNYLPPAQLLLGFGVMFRISAESKARHIKHRVDAGQDNVAAPTIIEAETERSENGSEATEAASVPRRDETGEMSHGEDEKQENGSVASEDPDDPNETDGESDEETDASFKNPLQPTQADSQQIQEQMEDLSLQEGSEESEQDEEGEPIEQDDEGEPIEQESEQAPEGSEQADSATNDASSQAPKVKQPQPVRGKRGKQAKMKAKYADQDEEERALAMQLLGSNPMQQAKKKTGAEAQAAKETELQAQKERRRLQHQREQQKGKAAEDARHKQIEAGADIMDPEESAELALVENFVGTPLPGDEILDGLVVCGPWDALGPKLRWRVKIQPGTAKRGRALKEILAAWNKDIAAREKKKAPPSDDPNNAEDKLLRREGELIKAMKDVELVGCIPVGKLRLIMGGGSGNTDAGGKGKGGGNRGGGKSGKGGRGGKGSKKAR